MSVYRPMSFDKETCVSMCSNVKDDAYEMLLDAIPADPCARSIRASCSSRNAGVTMSGTDQSLTPHPLIQATA
jgi:hypothetical protein